MTSFIHLVRPLAGLGVSVIGVSVIGVSVIGVSLGMAACSTGTEVDEGTGGQGGDQSDGSGGQGGESGGSPGLGGGGAGGEGALPPGAISCDLPAACGLRECLTEEAVGNHQAPCSELNPHTNPPTSGPHYTEWAQFGVYDEPIPDGFLMHGLEHSAVALLYNCTLVEAAGDSCDDLVAELRAFYSDYPDDPLCTSVPHRLYVLPDPNLDVPFAATAWKAHLKGQCFDPDRVREFVDDHYGQNYENICYSGVDPLDPGCD